MKHPIFRVCLVIRVPALEGQLPCTLLRVADMATPPHTGDVVHATDDPTILAMPITLTEYFPGQLAPRLHLQPPEMTHELVEHLLTQGWSVESNKPPKRKKGHRHE